MNRLNESGWSDEVKNHAKGESYVVLGKAMFPYRAETLNVNRFSLYCLSVEVARHQETLNFDSLQKEVYNYAQRECNTIVKQTPRSVADPVPLCILLRQNE
jgi:hypothetical protein